MFTLDQIKAAHSKVKSGADFPTYVRELINLGLGKYDCYVGDGHSVYFSKTGESLKSESKYDSLKITETANTENFKKALKKHQQGGSDYLTFCQDCARTGVEKWTVDTVKMTCTYYDQKGNEMLVEHIPRV